MPGHDDEVEMASPALYGLAALRNRLRCLDAERLVAVQLLGRRRLDGALLRLGLLALLFLACLGAQLLALLLAGVAFAADRLQVFLEVIGAVVVVDLLAGRDVLDGADIDAALLLLDVGFGIRAAGVVDVTRNVLAHRA